MLPAHKHPDSVPAPLPACSLGTHSSSPLAQSPAPPGDLRSHVRPMRVAKGGFLRCLFASQALSQQEGGGICVVFAEKQHTAWTPPSLELSPLILFLSTVESQTALQAWVIYRRLHSQRHPFSSQSKRTPNGPDLSLQGPTLGLCIEQSRGGKKGRKGSVCICLAGCPCLGLEFI